MKIALPFVAMVLLLTGCGVTRCLHCPFDALETARSSTLSELNRDWELHQINAEGQPEKQVGNVTFFWDGEISEQQWLVAQIEVRENQQMIKQPPLRGLGADLNGETFLALCLDLPELAKQAGFSQPGNLAIPVYSLLRLKKSGKNLFLVEGISFARYQEAEWVPVDPRIQVNADGLVSNNPDILQQLLKEKKYVVSGKMLLKRKE